MFRTEQPASSASNPFSSTALPFLTVLSNAALSAVSLALLCFVCLFAHSRSEASTGKRYVQLRRESHYDSKLSYADVQENASKYIGRVIELRGTIGGVAEGSTSMSLMLNMENGSTPALEAPLTEADVLHDSTTPRVRVLAKIADGSSGNVVPLTVLAMANDFEVDALEKLSASQTALQARKAELALQERERWHTQVMRTAPRSTVPSRSNFSRVPTALPPGSTTGLPVYMQEWYPIYYNFILNHNPKLGAKLAGQIAFYLLKFSDLHKVDPRLVTAMIIAESDFDPQSTSHSGAMGLGQLMPDEVKSLGLNNGYDIEQNLFGSVANLRTDLNSFASLSGPNGTLSIEQIRLAMATYNAGPNAVKKYNGVPPYRETQGYVKRVVKLYRQFCGLPPE